MAQLTIQTTSLSGTTISYAAATAGGDKFNNDGKTKLRVKNGGASSITVTVASPQVCSQGYTHDVADTVAAGAELEIGPFTPSRFNDSDQNISVTYSGVTSVTVAAVR